MTERHNHQLTGAQRVTKSPTKTLNSTTAVFGKSKQLNFPSEKVIMEESTGNLVVTERYGAP